MDNCIFCKIGSGELPKKPEEKRFEDDNFIAFLDIHPKAPGHTILIPKSHHRWFIDLPDYLSDGLFRTAKKVAQDLKKEFSADFVRLGIVGTDVPHVHIHLIPQTIKDAGPEI